MTAKPRPNWMRKLERRTSAGWQAFFETLPGGRGRRALWMVLIALVMAVLITLVWLAGRYETSQLQAELDADTASAVYDLSLIHI